MVTRIVNKAEEILKEEKENIDNANLQQHTLELRKKRKSLTKLNNAMWDLLVENEQNKKACEEEAVKANEIQEKIGFCLRKIEEALIFIRKVESVTTDYGQTVSHVRI